MTAPRCERPKVSGVAPSRTPPSAEYVRSALSYCAATGIFIWRHRSDVRPEVNTRRVGATAGRLDEGYWRIQLNGHDYKAHRLAWLVAYGEWPIRDIDHINGDPSDNRICNLRLASVSENQRNRGAQRNNTSGVKGVSWDRSSKKWRASIKIHKQQNHLGLFHSLDEAAAAYRNASIALHREFGRSV